MTEYTTKILKLNEIAFWWLHASMEEARPKVCAVLPSLQRGFVWRTSQIELLWDSIAQGFPIGSLLLSAYDSKQVSVSGHGSDGPISNPTHLILDGQQRATALALGFRDIWSKPKTAVEALWVDLVSLKGDRHFAFRVVTKAHPWGYRRTDPNARLTAHDARKALEVYRYICGDEKIEPHKLDLSKTFPWDSEAPVPLALLINSIRENQFKSGNDFYKETIKSLGKSLSEISIWEKLVAYNGEGDKAREAIDEAREKIEKVNRIINGADNESLKDLVGGIRHALKNTEVPAAVLKLKQPVDEKNKSEKDDADENTPIFNLFKRINNGGTSLTREEINYSMLKSVWPGAREAIEGVDGEGGLLGGRQFAHPARMVSLITRLYIMSHTKDNDTTQLKNMQAELNISQFSTRLKDNEFISGLEGFCTNKGRVVVEETWKLLTEGEDSLPVVLAARLSQNADDLLLLLMYWIYQISKLKMKISDVTRSRTLGFVVSVSWFVHSCS